jgi:hypothetical protein
MTFYEVKSLDELDQKLKERNIIDGRWGGKTLPFPILLDPSGETLKMWRIRGFPTMYLIDPKGNVASMGHHGVEDLLRAELAKLAKP